MGNFKVVILTNQFKAKQLFLVASLQMIHPWFASHKPYLFPFRWRVQCCCALGWDWLKVPQLLLQARLAPLV